jgi:ABC-type transport system involved in multi-copper enzyme maturation permease subunit
MFSAFDAQQWLTWCLIVLVGLVVLGVMVFLARGLFQARSLIRREFATYFLSPVGYVVLVVFLGMTGWLFYRNIGLLTAEGPEGTRWPMQSMFGEERFWLVFLFIPPLLTMRLFAEERSSGTLEMLMTAPLRDWQVVLCKYVACLGFYCVMWLPTLVYLPVLLGARRPVIDLQHWTFFRVLFLSGLGAALLGILLLLPRLGTRARVVSVVLIGVGIAAAVAGGWLHYHEDAAHVLTVPRTIDDVRPVLTTYLGMFLAGAMFLSLGLLVSSLVRDQMVSALIALVLSLLFIGAVFWAPQQDGSLFARLVYFVSVPLHFQRDFTRGVLDSRQLVLYVSVTLFCLFVTVRSLESRRWHA